MQKQIILTISGQAKTGKTTVGVLVTQHLRSLGFRVSLRDEDGSPLTGSDPIGLLEKKLESLVNDTEGPPVIHILTTTPTKDWK